MRPVSKNPIGAYKYTYRGCYEAVTVQDVNLSHVHTYAAHRPGAYIRHSHRLYADGKTAEREAAKFCTTIWTSIPQVVHKI